MSTFLVALQFLTRFPVPRHLMTHPHQWGSSVLFYPLVGIIIGCFLNLMVVLLPMSDVNIKAAIILTAWVAITGGLHLDGLGDCADAWAGGFNNPERSLALMKDPHSGVIAIVVLILVLLLKWTALSHLLAQKQVLIPLMIIPALGRSAILGLMLTSPYVSHQGLGEKLTQSLPKKLALSILVFTVILASYYLSVWALLGAVIMVMAIRHVSHQRLAGVTGDVYGASVELVEVTVLIAII